MAGRGEIRGLQAAGWTVVEFGPWPWLRSRLFGRHARRPVPHLSGARRAGLAGSSRGGSVMTAFVVDCPACCLSAGPFPGVAEAEHLAGTHDDLIHRGEPTAVVLAEHAPAGGAGAA
jgi:hypothetical protein